MSVVSRPAGRRIADGPIQCRDLVRRPGATAGQLQDCIEVRREQFQESAMTPATPWSPAASWPLALG